MEFRLDKKYAISGTMIGMILQSESMNEIKSYLDMVILEESNMTIDEYVEYSIDMVKAGMKANPKDKFPETYAFYKGGLSELLSLKTYLKDSGIVL